MSPAPSLLFYIISLLFNINLFSVLIKYIFECEEGAG
jgi:hypothetical protein